MLKQAAKSIIRVPLIAIPMDAIASTGAGRHLLNKLDWPHGIFPDFKSGWEVAKSISQQGHGYNGSVTRHFQLSSELRKSDLPVVEGLRASGLASLNIYDFGGNAGNLYYSYRSHLDVPVRWTVTDMPNVMEQGRNIARERNVQHELFFSDSCPSDCNVLLISGTYHYWEGNLKSFLVEKKCGPTHIFINRSPFHDRGPFVTIQRLKGCAFPCIVRNQNQLVEEARQLGYALRTSWNEPDVALNIPLFPKYSVRGYSGLHFILDQPLRN